MIGKNINLIDSFSKYLDFALNKVELNDIEITMSVYGALVGMDTEEDMAELMPKMVLDYEHIVKVLTQITKDMEKSRKIESINQKNLLKDKWVTSKEAAEIYDISEQAIRKACREGRLSYEKGTGKIKYLIKKEDIAKYMQSAKGKGCKEAA